MLLWRADLFGCKAKSNSPSVSQWMRQCPQCKSVSLSLSRSLSLSLPLSRVPSLWLTSTRGRLFHSDGLHLIHHAHPLHTLLFSLCTSAYLAGPSGHLLCWCWISPLTTTLPLHPLSSRVKSFLIVCVSGYCLLQPITAMNRHDAIGIVNQNTCVLDVLSYSFPFPPPPPPVRFPPHLRPMPVVNRYRPRPSWAV